MAYGMRLPTVPRILQDQKPRASNCWKSPYERFYTYLSGNEKESFRKAQEEMFVDFAPEKITLAFRGAFIARRKANESIIHKNLRPLPWSIRDLETRPFCD